MRNEQWWSELKPATREWLIAHNGEAVPQDVADAVAAAGGPVAMGPVEGEDGEPGLFYADDVIDRIEEIANTEDPRDPV